MKTNELKTGDVMTVGNRWMMVLRGTTNGDVIVGNADWKPIYSHEEEKPVTCHYGQSTKVYRMSSVANRHFMNIGILNDLPVENGTGDWRRIYPANKRLKLNSEHTAEIDPNTETVKVGCQTFTFDKIKELYELTK